MGLSRRDALRGLFAGGAVICGQRSSVARATAQPLSLTLDNGFRAHIVANNSRYIAAALLLRSSEIRAADGLAHILEHTSFAGAAGAYSAEQIKRMQKDYIQDSNASTEPGMIHWEVSFLPKYLEQVLGLLAVISLDQRCDVETVRQEARVVLQELYLDRYQTRSSRGRLLDAALFGNRHPYGMDTTDSEIAKVKTRPDRLAVELRAYAQTIKLPANMDLFLVGGFDPSVAGNIVAKCFGSFPFAQGPMLSVPQAPVTRTYRTFTASSPELRRPLAKIKIAWNTGIGVAHHDAKVVLALSEYLNAMLFRRLRERHGDTYAPVASYDPDVCSGIFEIDIPSTQAPHRIEYNVFESIAELKAHIGFGELARFRDRLELKRRQNAESNEAVLERLVQRTVDGGSLHDFDLDAVTRDAVLAAARRHLPSYKGAYIRLSMIGR